MTRALAAAVALATLAGMLPLSAQGPRRAVAVTIDDLPRGGDGSGSGSSFDAVWAMNEKLLSPFKEDRIPLTGFVNAHHELTLGADTLRRLLDLWLDAGAELGNHTYSHPDINNVALADYTADVVKGEPILRAALEARGRTLRYFRHPFLHAGPTAEIKSGLQAFLHDQGYRVAPVTLDDSDYMYAALYTRAEYRERVRREYVPYMESIVEFFEQRSVEVAGREFPQVLLIHDNQLNADVMPDLLDMFRRRGYRFVTLDEALADEAYHLADEYVGRGGFSWIHRWSKTKGMPAKGEPDPPAWVTSAFGVR
ncbi:MAG TPA: polysaccharide deacetylase family protein [Vicinamibacterales bacterium]|jgi:peptidoglycan/xylan/chitin deacetylase (PgdA/CDA1 family)|nr:polysaccharide deacetylase family protein [Vicinamibacterales bacterium]